MIKKTSIKCFLSLVCLVVAFLIMGCSASQVDQEYIDFADEATENYLIATNNRDFDSFSRDLGKDMKEALPEEEFLKFADQIEGIIGTYEPGSKVFVDSEKQSGFIIIVYNAKYTEESADVEIRITLQKVDDKIEIAGSWFNSPRLRGE